MHSMKRLVLLIGAMGSGKSTYCEQRLKGYTRISQDEQGKERHRILYREALERGDEFVVVDRVNHDRAQRGNYLSLAKKHGYTTRIVWFTTDRETCLKRCKARKYHVSLKPEDAESALAWYFKSLRAPSSKEADELELIGPPPSFVPVKDVTAEIGNRRHIIVGDIHGCLDELKQMLDELAFNKDEDVLICVGDLVDRGPKVKETLEFVMSLPRFYSVKGNHDDKCVRYFSGNPVKVGHGLEDTIEQYGNKMPAETLEYLRNLPLILKTPSGYVVHAGFDPLLLPEQQKDEDCLYMRYYGGRSYFDNNGGVLWYTMWPKDFPRVFYGHIPEPSGPNLPNVVSLDGGCVFGDYMKAWDSRDGIVYYVQAAKQYSLNHFAEATLSPHEVISKREEYCVAGLLRKDVTDDGELAIYTYTDQCVFDRAWDVVTRNSRGHIFNVETGECIAWAFPKFYNLNENEDSLYEKFDWTQEYFVYEKMDGWLGVLYRHNGEFKVASRGSFHSDGAIWASNHIKKFDLSCLPEEVTLCFEIINPRQRIILDYGGQEDLVVLAAFDRRNGSEYPRATVEEWCVKSGLPIVKRHAVTVTECLKFQKDAKNQEGFVIAFPNGQRIKIKTEWYLTLAKVMSHLSPIAIWETMVGGKVQQAFMVQVPEELRPLAEQYRTTLEAQYDRVRNDLYSKAQAHINKYGNHRKQIAMNRDSLKGTIAYKGVFSVLDKNDKEIDKMIMDAIYPTANEFVAL